ncbi:glycosyltransferase [Streptomyces sp. NPDC088400]|uniref:glycosyltransferase family protein n=1 Tax=Streptomyces sp. NPDC088400 TaxID=3365861 RepID=UPI003801813D
MAQGVLEARRTDRAPDTVREGETGFVVDGRKPELVAERLVHLLTDRAGADEMGRKGRAWVTSRWTWDAAYERLSGLLAGA